MQTIGTGWLWGFFCIFIGSIIFIDAVILKQKNKSISVKYALTWTLIWVVSALVFNGFLWGYVTYTSGSALGSQKALEFFTGYVIEELLSVDNMFAFLLIFNYFSVPLSLQRRVLLFGVIGAVVMRLAMILLGAWLIARLHWILYVFGLFLFVTGIKMLFASKEGNRLQDNVVLNWIKNHIRLTPDFHDEHFFIKRNKLWYATPLFLTLIMIELSDLVFALDSIPAIFAVTNDPFIVFTSNIFAILGLRVLYFVLRDAVDRFYLLNYGVALVLAFIGAKMLMEPWWNIPILLALGVVMTVLFITIVFSLLTNRHRK